MNKDSLIRVPITYIGLDDMPVLFANNFVVQHEQTEFILTAGQLVPPVLLGTTEERLEQAKQLGYVGVRVVARLALTRDRVTELIQVLQDNLTGC